MTSIMKRPRETHRHDYTRPSASLSDEVGGLSTALGLFASPSMMLSTESVVVVEWKGVRTSRARQLQHHSTGRAAHVAIDVLMRFYSIITTDSVESISDGLAKSPSAVLNPPTSLPMHVVLRQ